MADRAALSEQSRGWLRHMWEKATTPDDWSSSGEPHPWWDRYSTAPMCAFPRFDLFEPSYALAIMSDLTPAWREVYARIADGLVARHTTFWAAIDWLTLIGPDPGLDRYPPEWQIFVPEQLRGRYEVCGWTANGVEPWGLQPDPIGADGNLFFRGYLNLLLGLYRYIAGDDKWDRPFPVTGYRDRQFEWTHSRIAEFLTVQMEERPQGPHCENTKIYPHCVSAAGAGLLLFDALADTNNQRVFHAWLDFAKAHYMGIERGELSWWATYYDPIEEVAHKMPGPAAAFMLLEAAPYMYPADRDLVGRLYEMGARRLGLHDAKGAITRQTLPPHMTARALFLAREFGDETVERRLRDLVERECEPRRFGDEGDRFGYFFGLGDEWPRGQLNGMLMMSEVGRPGDWWRLFNEPNVTKHLEPTVEGVAYPDLAIVQAYNDTEAGLLWVQTCAGTPSRRGAPTTWRVSKLADPAVVRVTCDGQDFASVQVVGDDTIELRCDIADHLFRLEVGTAGGEPRRTGTRFASPAGGGNGEPREPASARAERSAGRRAHPQASGCGCCATAVRRGVA